MSGVRDRLLAELRAELPARYLVGGSWATPDTIDPDRLAVRCWAAELRPGDTIGSLVFTVVLWVLSPATDPDRLDTDLDTALGDLLAVLHPKEWVRWSTATRGVLDDVWHGYRFDLTAAATFTTDPTAPTPK